MTYVVAQIHNSKITVVGDTQITDNRPGHDFVNRHIYENAMPKIAVLRKDLVVAVADDNPAISLQKACALRAVRAAEVVESLERLAIGHFLVASLSPTPRLWRIREGDVEERTAVGRCFIGSEEADGHFRDQYGQLQSYGQQREVDFLMSGSLQWLLNFDAVQGVGGYPTRVATTSDGFRFLPDQASVGPDEVNAYVSRFSGGYRFSIRVPRGVSPQGYDLRVAVGQPPTIGAFACFIPQARTARLFTEREPWDAKRVTAQSMNDLLRQAQQDYGQVLQTSEPAPL